MKKFFIPLAFIFGFLVIFPKFAFGDLIIPLSNEEKVIEGLHRDVTNTKGLYRDGHNKEIQSSHSSDELYQKIVKNQKEQLRVENEKLRVKQNQLKRKEK
ncbi:MAG: hypothetical protein J6S61_01995, partial [Elusimicrobiaceae bacterium]|nr:hypothetical protein [Elusimicrobiaceae bacterium]